MLFTLLNTRTTAVRNNGQAKAKQRKGKRERENGKWTEEAREKAGQKGNSINAKQSRAVQSNNKNTHRK